MKLAVITGCDSGIGAALSKKFLETGYTVTISYLEKKPFRENASIIARRLDLRNERQIQSFADLVNRCCNKGFRLEYFINNAGVAMGGPFENIPMAMYRSVFEINFFGLVSLTQKILPSLIRSRGRLVINGSMAGRVALPYLSPYVATKYALEGWCDSVRRELNPLGIRTILLEPGGIATPIWHKALAQDYTFADNKYDSSIGAFKEKFIESGLRGMDVDRAAAMIFRFISGRRPRARYIVADNRPLSFLETLIPSRLLDILVTRIFAMRYGPIQDK